MPLTTLLRKLVAILSPGERASVVVLCLLSLVGAVAEALSIGAVFPFMALLSNPDATLAHPVAIWLLGRLGSVTLDHLILFSAFGLLILFLLKNLFLIIYYAYQSRFTCALESRLGATLLSAYLQAPYTARLTHNSADRIRVVTGESGRVSTGVILSLITLVAEGFVIAAIAALLLAAQPLVAIVSVVVIAAFALMMLTIFRRNIDKYRDLRVRTGSAMFRWVNEGLGALKEIKVLGREEHVIGEFTRSSRAYSHGTYVFTTLNLLPRIVFETAAICTLLVAVIAAVLVGMPLVDIVPVLTIFGLAALRLLPSASRIMASLNTLRYFTPAVETVAADLRLVSASAAAQPPASASMGARDRFALLHLDNVSYRYLGSDEDSLRKINLRVARGDAIAIVGRSGSGKTTLADLLLGLLDPTAGTVEVNGRPIHSLRAEWRGIAGLVPQDIFLIDDTVRRNVAFGLPDAAIDDARVWHALGMARLEERVRALSQGLDTPVGERGATLSGGERQRLGIARALYTDPDILVLDEATSALDAATEAEFIGVLQSLRGTKTIFAITHRVATVGWCDRVLVMGSGRIVADGAFAEISSTNPAFAELVSGEALATIRPDKEHPP